MHSRSAACVFGDARFTSSTSRRFAKTGPGLNSNSLVRWSKTLTPVTSEGRRSGVNWRREKSQSSDRASAFASIVFPTPGKSSMIRWPSATRQRTTSRRVSAGAWTTRARLPAIAATRSAGCGASAGREAAQLGTSGGDGLGPCLSSRAVPSGSAKEQALHLVEDGRRDLVLRRLLDEPLPGRGDERHLVVAGIEADVVAPHIVEDEEVGVLVGELLPRAPQSAVALVCREADEQLPGHPASAELGEHVGRRLELDGPGRAVLGALCCERLGGAIVRNGGGHDHHVGRGSSLERFPLEVGGARCLDDLDAGRRGDGEVRAEQ